MLSGHPIEEVEDVVGVEGVAETNAVEEVVNQMEVDHLQEHQVLSPSIQIFHLENGQGAACTEDTAEEHISAQNLQPARGKTFLLLNQNEILTSLATLTQPYFMIHYTTRLECQKYIQFVTMRLKSRNPVHFQLSRVIQELITNHKFIRLLSVVLLWSNSFIQGS